MPDRGAYPDPAHPERAYPERAYPERDAGLEWLTDPDGIAKPDRSARASRRWPRWPRRGWSRALLALVVLVVVVVIAAGAWAFATREVLVLPTVAAPDRTAVDQTGGWPQAPASSRAETVNVTYHCTLKAAGVIPVVATDLAVSTTGIFPLKVGPAQPFYVTNGQTTAVLPARTVNRLEGLGIRQFSGQVTRLDLLAPGATPAARNALATAAGIPPTRLVRDHALTLRAPTSGHLTIGPFTSTAGRVDLGVGAWRAALKAVGPHGVRVPGKVALECPRPDPVVPLASIAVGGPTSSRPAKIDGTLRPAVLPPDGALLGTNIPLGCTVGSYGRFTMTTAVTAYAPQAVVRTGQVWSLLNGHGSVTVPSGLRAALAEHNPAATTVAVTLTQLGTLADGSSPANQNYLAAPVNAAAATLTGNGSLVASFPARGLLLAPARFVAGPPGLSRIYLGPIVGSIRLSDRAGQAVGGPIGFSCPTTRPLIALASFAVTP